MKYKKYNPIKHRKIITMLILIITMLIYIKVEQIYLKSSQFSKNKKIKKLALDTRLSGHPFCYLDDGLIGPNRRFLEQRMRHVTITSGGVMSNIHNFFLPKRTDT